MTLSKRLSPNLEAQLGMIKKAAVEIWDAPQHRHYTDHKPEKHSERIIEKLNAMADLMEVPLGETEWFILLSAAYLHDIGMQTRLAAELSLDDVRDQHHELSRDMIEGSITKPNEFRSVGLTREFADEVALVSAAHRKLNLAAPEFDPRTKGGQEVRLRLLSAMLRLADALDLDYRRVIMDNLRLEQVSSTSRLHWWCCDYVEGVAIRQGAILVECAVPSEDYAYYIRTSLENEVRAEVEKVRPFLWPHVKLAVGDVICRVSATKEAMSAGDFDALRAQVRHEMEAASQLANERIGEMRSREERAAKEAADEGRRLSGSDPPAAAELLQQAVRLFLRLNQPHAVAAQLELMANIHDKRGEWPTYCAIREDLGHLYLQLENPFLAKWAFTEAQEKTPLDETWESQEAHLRRGLHCASARMLWGEFEGMQQFLDQVGAVLQGRTSQVGALWHGAQLQLHEFQNQWKEACVRAQHFMSDLRTSTPATDVEANLADAGYELSLVASLAGDHILASEWIEQSFRFDESSRARGEDAREGNGFALHARRGVLRWRAGRRGAAMKDFFQAVRYAERLGDDVSTLIQLENAMVVAREKMVPLHPFLKARESKMGDLQLRVGEMRGLPPDGGDDYLADNFSTSLIALQKALTRNDLRGLPRAQIALARIKERSNHPSEALELYVAAGMGASKEITGAVTALLEKSEAQTRDCFHELFGRAGATDAEMASLGAIIIQAADFLPDHYVEPLVSRFLEKIESVRASENLISALLPAIGELAPRLSDVLAERVALLGLKLLNSPQLHQHTVLEAATKVIGSLATNLPSGKSCVTRLSLDIRAQVVGCLAPLIENDTVGSNALATLMEVGFSRDSQEDDGAVPPLSDEEKALRSRTKSFLESLAVEKRQIVPLRIYVGAEVGSIPDELARGILLRFSQQADEELNMALTSHINFSAHETSLSALKSFVRCLRPGVLSAPEATHLFERILELAEHPDNIISRREVALHTLGCLADPLFRLQEAGDIAGDFLSRTAATAENVFRAPNLGVIPDWLTQGAANPLNRFKMNMGTVDHFQGTALRALGRLLFHLPADESKRALSVINEGVGHLDAEVRDGAAYALRKAHPALDAIERGAALMQLYALLHDGDPDIRTTALYALEKYGEDIQPSTAPLLFNRVLTLSSAPQHQVRRNAVHLLQVLGALPIFQSRKTDVTSRLEEMRTDVSFAVRHAAINLVSSNLAREESVEGDIPALVENQLQENAPN